MTALHYGCKAGNVEICSLLLHNGALLEAYDRVCKSINRLLSDFNFIFIV